MVLGRLTALCESSSRDCPRVQRIDAKCEAAGGADLIPYLENLWGEKIALAVAGQPASDDPEVRTFNFVSLVARGRDPQLLLSTTEVLLDVVVPRS